MGALENHDKGGAGETVNYAHGSESLRTYLGKSKFHPRSDCRVLLGRNPNKTVVQDRVADLAPSMRCKVCSPK